MARKKTDPSPKKPTPSPAKVRGNARAKSPKKGKGGQGNGEPEAAGTPAPGGRMVPPKKGVKVRMYRTGLGDCFLLAFPGGHKRADGQAGFYLLVDCGIYKGTPKTDRQPGIDEIVKDIRDATGGHLDLLVITHEHWDHVSAFHPSQAQAIFDKEIALGKLWMAWTEDGNIKLARDLNDGRKAARAALVHVATRMQGLKGSVEANHLVTNVLDFFGGTEDDVLGASPDVGLAAVFGAKSVQTESAMKWIKENYGKGKTEFLHPGDGPLELDGVDGCRVYILGPPEDPGLIKHYNPVGDEVYPKAMAAAIEAAFFAAFGVVPTRIDALPDSDDVKEARRMSLPFDEIHQVKVKGADGAEGDQFFREHYYDDKNEWRQIEGAWLEAAGEFALQLDSATNNTSLAFALEMGPPGKGKVLLFPGDAQVGNWLSWFGKVQLGKQLLGKEMTWTVGDKTITAEDLLRRTVLYKVGHHGSHNATLRAEGLERMGRPGELVAMLPVDEHVARDLAHYGEMPLRSLVKDLSLRTGGRVARNDEGATPKDHLSTLAPIPGAPALNSNFVDAKTRLYFEYTVVPQG